MHKLNYQTWPCQLNLRSALSPKAVISRQDLDFWGDLRRQNLYPWACLHVSWSLNQSQRHVKGDMREGYGEEKSSETKRHPHRKKSVSRSRMTKKALIGQMSERERRLEIVCASEKQQEKRHHRQRGSWGWQHSTVGSYKHWLLRRQKDNLISRGTVLAKWYFSSQLSHKCAAVGKPEQGSKTPRLTCMTITFLFFHIVVCCSSPLGFCYNQMP